MLLARAALGCLAAPRLARPAAEPRQLHASAVLMRLPRDEPAGLARLLRRLRANPADPFVHFQVAGEQAALGRLVDAARSMRRSLELGIEPGPAVAAYQLIAQELVEASLYSEAERCWRHSLELEPENLGVKERLAFTLRLAGKLKEAASTLHELIHDLDGDVELQSDIYLDLGSVIDQMLPLAGTGPEWLSTGTGGSTLVPSRKAQVGPDPSESLSAEECYQRAILLNPENGEAHKRLADLLVLLRGPSAAHSVFMRAAQLMPEDICCAVHCYLGCPNEESRRLPPLPIASKYLGDAPRGLQGLSSLVVERDSAEWVSHASSDFEAYGAAVFPKLLSSTQCEMLRNAVEEACHDDTVDLTSETRNSKNRLHKGLRISADIQGTLSSILATMYPLLSRILQSETFPLIGTGFMCVSPGAAGQELHKDVHGHDRHGVIGDLPSGGSARAVSMQIQLTDTTLEEQMGSLELLPASHRPDAAQGHPSIIGRAVREPATCVIPVAVPAGTVTLYSSRLWHRGSDNMSNQDRIFCFLTFTETESPAPPGLIHTACKEDVGKWVVDSRGLSLVTEVR